MHTTNVTKTGNAIEARHLSKHFKSVDVLRDVSFNVPRGSIFALLGANGAGKTTTINILTTLTTADGGSATIDGIDVAKRPAQVRARISLTGQFAAVDEILTARENLLLIGRLRHVKDPAALANSLLGQFDLTDAADRRTSTFSGGMRRRLDIAMSLIGNPSIIFLDEPTTGLDIQSRTMMWETIRGLARSGVTIFLTTQYLEEADQLADLVAVLSHGTIVAHGTPAALKQVLPGGRTVLRFRTAREMAGAKTALGDLAAASDTENASIAITTDGSVREVAKIFERLAAAKIEVAEFAQEAPTLDEAFIQIIEKAGKGT